jgi:CheY-like chemotaxis protein
MKPVSQSELLDAIVAVAGKSFWSPDRLQNIAQQSPRSSNNNRNLNILLVEDNSINQVLAVTILERQGHTVVVAGNGKIALETIREPATCGFDLVLLDVQMPDMDGFEVTGVIRRMERSTQTHLPIVAMTAHAMRGDRERCLAAGMDGYLAKAIDQEKLVTAIEDLISAQESHSQG